MNKIFFTKLLKEPVALLFQAFSNIYRNKETIHVHVEDNLLFVAVFMGIDREHQSIILLKKIISIRKSCVKVFTYFVTNYMKSLVGCQSLQELILILTNIEL